MSTLAPLVIGKSVSKFPLGDKALGQALQIRLLEYFDTTDNHGGLLSLCEIANAYRESEKDPSVLEGHLRNVRCDLYLN